MTDLEASQMLGVTLATAKRLATQLDVPPNEWCPDDVFAADALLDQENEDEDSDGEDADEDEDDDEDEAAEVDEDDDPDLDEEVEDDD